MSSQIELIKILRDRTGAGLMDCKKALLENDSDIEKAIVWLREKGISKQEKKAGRTAAEGVAWVLTKGNKAAIIEINCETDFVANSDPFRDLVKAVNKAVLDNEPKTKEEALECKPDRGKTIKDLFLDATIKLGEKLDFRRFAIIEKKDEEIFGPYIHMNGKIATIVILQGGDASVANGVSLNVTSCNPTYVYESEIPAEIVARETEIETEASKNDPAFAKKPEIIKQKIIEGRVRKNLCANVLASQPYVLDETKSVGSFLKENNATIVSFVRYAVGEGIEKKQSDFAAEVESQMKM